MANENKSKFIQWLLVWAVSIGSFAVALTTTSIMTAIPMISQALNLSDAEATWAVNVYMLGAASLIILGGRMGDMFNPRRVFYAGNLLFLIGSILVASASNSIHLLLGRIIQGFGVAFIIPNSLAIIKDTFHDKNKEKVGVGIWSGVVSLGFAVGPLVAGLMVNSIGWRYVFWLNIPITILSFVICIFIKNSVSVRKIIKIDYIGQISLIISILLIAFALTEGVQWGLGNAWTWIILVAGIIVFILFYYLEKHIEQPTVAFTIFKNWQFTAAFVLIFLTFYTLISILLMYNLFVQNPVTLDYTAMEAGLSLLPTTVSIFILSFIMPKLGNKIGFRYPAVFCFLLMAIGLAMFFFIKTDVTYTNLWLPLLLIGLGLGGTFPCFSGVALSTLPPEQVGLGSGMVSIAMYATGIISAAIGSLIYVNISSYQTIAHLKTLKDIPQDSLMHFAQNVSAGKPLDVILKSIPDHYHTTALSIAKIATVHAFNGVMLVSAILCVIGSIISFYGIKNEKAIKATTDRMS